MTAAPKIQTIQELIDEAASCAAEKGWDDKPPDLAVDLANLHGEVSEAWEDVRAGRAPDEIYYDHSEERPDRTYTAKPCGVPTELADVVIRIAHMAKRHGIDLVAAINLKAAYNRTRPRRHGGKKF